MPWSQPVQEGIRIAGGLSLLSLPVVSGGVWDQVSRVVSLDSRPVGSVKRERV